MYQSLDFDFCLCHGTTIGDLERFEVVVYLQDVEDINDRTTE